MFLLLLLLPLCNGVDLAKEKTHREPLGFHTVPHWVGNDSFNGEKNKDVLFFVFFKFYFTPLFSLSPFSLSLYFFSLISPFLSLFFFLFKPFVRSPDALSHTHTSLSLSLLFLYLHNGRLRRVPQRLCAGKRG